MEIMRGALIGCGGIAREHLSAVSEIANVQMAAVCDVSAARAEATAERFGVAKWYSKYQDMIAQVRPVLVHITTPPASHFSIAKTCLEAGLNVFCEKPITTNYEEFCELKQLATRKHCLLLEDQNYRFHSSIRRICELVNLGLLGDIIDVQICLSMNLFARGNPYIDRNAPHFGVTLRGGVIGDFLTHLAYLAYMFAGPVVDLRATWSNRSREPSLTADEFRALIKGVRATAYIAFSGNAQPDAFWLRVVGSRMHAEANLFEPPRLTLRRLQPGEPALVKLVDGIAEARDVLKGTVSSFCRKLGGVSSYDGLSELIGRTYRSLEKGGPPPIALEEIDEVASIVDRLSKIELGL